MTNIKLAVVGRDVSYSLSPEIHQFIAKALGFEICYDKISIAEEEFDNKITDIFKNYEGFNVTIPFKLKIMPFLKNIVGDAEVFGAVNTVLTKNLSGYNTDGLGFMLMLKNRGIEVSGKDVLVLGAGGAGRSIVKKLSEAGAKVYLYNRTYERAKELSEEFNGVTALKRLGVKSYYLIVNATSAGMKEGDNLPVEEEIIKLSEVCADIIYSPPKTQFLKIAEKYNKKIINGEAMLFYQAYYSDCIYFGLQPNDVQAKELFEKYQKISE